MIIGNELCAALEGLTINVDGRNIEVKSTFDDQYALEKFIKRCDESEIDKFPLVFCTTTKTTGEKVLTSTRQIVIMTLTNPDWLSKQRTASTFTKVIHPIFKKVIPLIDRSKNLKIMGDRKTRINFTDKTNYGVIKGEISKKISSQSAVSDYIDARIIDLTIQFDDSEC